MEQKLLDIKEMFCKWYCPGRSEEISISYVCSFENPNCHNDCAMDSISVCVHCQVEEYIRFAAEEIDKK